MFSMADNKTAVTSYKLRLLPYLLILLLATFFQSHQLVQDVRFHPDEAYFMSFARHASVNGDWMLAGSLDKPPLSIYMSALSMVLVGTISDANGVLHLDPHLGEFAGRLPNVFLAILTLALMMRLAQDLYYDKKVTLLSGLFMSTSPYLLAFGATAFTDMSLLFLLVLSLCLTVRGKWGWAGIALGLAFWSKQQAVFFVPLILLIGLYMKNGRGETCLTFTAVMRFVFGLIILLLALIIWDTARPDTSIFVLGTINNAPDSLLVDPSQYGSRLAIWEYWASWLMGQPWWTFIAILMLFMGGGWHMLKQDASRGIDALLFVFIIAYIGVHTVFAFNQYDRYILLILPALVLLCARGMSGIFRWLSQADRTNPVPTNNRKYVYILFLAILFMISTLLSLQIGIPIGGDKGDYQGIDELADYLNDKPIASVIYDRWLGWELDYYMGQWTNKRRVYFPTPAALAKGASALKEVGDRYLVAPIDEPLEAWLSALGEVGFTSDVDKQIEGFIVYRLSVVASDA